MATHVGTQEQIETQFAGASDRLRFLESLRGLIDWLVTGLIEGSVRAVRDAGVRSVDEVRDYPVRLVPAGRLDFDSEGLLLLTNDGDVIQRVLHPSHEVEKSYLTKVSNHLTPEEVMRIKTGVLLDGRMTSPARVRVIKEETFATTVLVSIHEGRNRQVRRMFEAIGHQVVSLKRVRFGPLQLGDLQRGHWRYLTDEEVQKLKEL